MFWKFEVIPEGWSCYAGATTNPERETYATRIIFIEGKFLPERSELCRINGDRSALDLPIDIRFWAGEPYRQENAEGLPQGVPDWYKAPSVYFGELSSTPRNSMSAYPAGLELMGQIPVPVFEDIWGWLKSGSHIQCVRCEAFGEQLTAQFADLGVSWSWHTGERGVLLVAGFGIRFGGQRE